MLSNTNNFKQIYLTEKWNPNWSETISGQSGAESTGNKKDDSTLYRDSVLNLTLKYYLVSYLGHSFFVGEGWHVYQTLINVY